MSKDKKKKKAKEYKKPQKPKRSFAAILAEKLKSSGLGEINTGNLGDDSCHWVNFRIDDTELCFAFDIKGEKIERIGLYKDVVEVVDQTKLWGS